MQSNPRWIAFDWFKLVVAILLLLLFIMLWLRPMPSGSADTARLPAYPHVSYVLHYDEASRSLLDTNGAPQFTLSADGKEWQPFIPESLKTNLPAGYSVVKISETFWEIRDASGRMLYSWGMDTFKWKPPAVEQPDIPAALQAGLPAGATVIKTVNGGWMILDQAGTALYIWDAQAGGWQMALPVIPGTLTEKLPTRYSTALGADGVWMIVGADGLPLYLWDKEASAWVQAAPQIPADLADMLPTGYRSVQKANGVWEIQDTAGIALFRWDTHVMGWVQVVPDVISTAASTPSATLNLTPEPTARP